jgi:thiopeptide-type bacteriocin biosynthesis protein
MTIALTGYLLRLRHRATPFGLFAGTAVIPLATAAAGGIGTRPGLLLRPSPRWLAGLVATLESDPELPGQAPRARVAPSPSLRQAGDIHVLLDPGAGGLGDWRIDSSVPASRLLDAVLAVAAGDRAGGGIGYAELLDLLHAAAPALGREQLAAYVSGLLAARLLITDLLPAPGDSDPLRHLIERLDNHPLAAQLSALRGDLRGDPHRDRRPASSRPAADDLRRLRAGLRAVRPRDAELVADTLLDTDLRLPEMAAREVERAAAAAWACAPPPAARPLAGLHQAMLVRYGLDRPVPLTELLDLTESLGLHHPPPAGDSAGNPRPAPAVYPAGVLAPADALRDRLLTGLALDALAAGRAELILRRPLRNQLAALSGTRDGLPPVDVFTEIVTASADALNRGDFLVVLGSHGSPGPPGSSAGRLADPLGPDSIRLVSAPEPDSAHLAGPRGSGAARVAGLPGSGAGGLDGRPPGSGAADPLDVELVFRPPDPAAANLLSETGWTGFRIDLTGQPARRTGRDILLAELVVIVTPDRLRLHCPRLGRDIRPVSFSALNPQRAGAVAGLLLDLGQHGAAPWRSWDWGTAGALPWLPRVRLGRAVLASARWTLPPGLRHLAQAGTDRQWRDGLLRWQDAEELPEVVFAGAWDQRLPLHLADPVHADLLRRECRDRGVTAVAEPPGGTAAWRGVGWPASSAGPHTAEFVSSLHPRPTGEPQGSGPSTDRPPARLPSAGGRLAGVRPADRPLTARPLADRPPTDCAPIDRAPTDHAPIDRPLADRTRASEVFLPGGCWLCGSLAVPEALQDSVLAQLADPGLMAAAGDAGVDRWFFARIAGPDGVPQLVVRFHCEASGLNQILLPALNAWSGRLRGAGLAREFSLTSYWPEQWRYGGAECMEAAERFFQSDSRLGLEFLGLESQAPAAPSALLAAPGVGHILAVMLDDGPAVGQLPRPRLSAPERRLFGRLRSELRTSPDGTDDWPPVTGRPPGDRTRSAWPGWHAALAAYRSRLCDAGQDRAPVAWSLVHMHCNRIAGPSRAAERMAIALARDLAIARSAAAGDRQQVRRETAGCD